MTSPDEPLLEDMAIQYAMLAPEHYFSGQFSADQAEAEQARMHHKMALRFGEYAVQQAIKQAHDVLKMMQFHPPGEH